MKSILTHIVAGALAALPVLASPGPFDAQKVGALVAAFLVGCGLLRRDPPK